MASSAEDSVLTDRLKGERPRREHGALYAELFGSAEVAQTLWPGNAGGPRTPAQAFELLEAEIGHWSRVSFGPWVFSERDTGHFVGRGGLEWTNVEGVPRVEVLYAVRHELWGQGYATEIAIASVQYARSLRLSEVVGFTLPTNIASLRVLEKAGLRFERDVEHADLPHWFGRIELPK